MCGYLAEAVPCCACDRKRVCNQHAQPLACIPSAMLARGRARSSARCGSAASAWPRAARAGEVRVDAVAQLDIVGKREVVLVGEARYAAHRLPRRPGPPRCRADLRHAGTPVAIDLADQRVTLAKDAALVPS